MKKAASFKNLKKATLSGKNMGTDIIEAIEREIDHAKTRLEEIDHFYNKDLRLLERLSDGIADVGGSWRFISIFVMVLVSWVLLNTLILLVPFDPYPFTLLNLFLSTIAAIQAPVILMSQKRAGHRDQTKIQMDLEKDIRDLQIDRHSHTLLLELQKDVADIKKKMKIR